MVRNSQFDAEEIEREKGVIVEEMNMYIDTPRDYVGSVYEELLFGSNPLGWETLGTKETIKGATRKTFLDYLGHWYTPQRMVVGVAGMVGDDLLPTLEGLLGDMSGNGSGAPVAGAGRALVRAEGAHPPQGLRPGAGLPRRPELPARPSGPLRAAAARHGARRGHVVAALPRGARAARPRLLRLRLNSSFTDAGTLYSQAGVDLARVDEAVKVIADRVPQARRRAVPDDELEKARALAKGRFVLQTESPNGLLTFGLRREVLEGKAVEPTEVLAGLDAVTADDVQRVAQDVIGCQGMSLAVIGPFDDASKFEALI